MNAAALFIVMKVVLLISFVVGYHSVWVQRKEFESWIEMIAWGLFRSIILAIIFGIIAAVVIFIIFVH